jgi:hypothetical protein
LATAFTVAVGLTVMVNVIVVPVQLTPAFVYVGVTITVAVTGAVVLFTAVNELMFPLPLAAKPMEGVLFAQLKTILLPAPIVLGLVNVIAAVEAVLHNTWFATAFTIAVGFTVMVNVLAIPTHEVAPFV